MELKVPPKTFISYSHDSLDHKRLVLCLANQLRAQGIDCIIDQYEESPDDGWIKWMDVNIAKSAYILIVCTKGYFDKLNSVNETSGKGVKWEGAIVTQEIYENEGKNRRFVPIIFGSENIEHVPRILKPFTYYDVLDNSSYERLYRRLTTQPAIKKPPLGNVIPFPLLKSELNPQKLKTEREKSIKQTLKGNNNVQIGEMHGTVSVHTLKPTYFYIACARYYRCKPIT